MSRDDLLVTNAKIMTSVINDIIKFNPNAIIIVVSNPLMQWFTQHLKASNWSRNKLLEWLVF